MLRVERAASIVDRVKVDRYEVFMDVTPEPYLVGQHHTAKISEFKRKCGIFTSPRLGIEVEMRSTPANILVLNLTYMSKSRVR